jgi:thioredoxin 1
MCQNPGFLAGVGRGQGAARARHLEQPNMSSDLIKHISDASFNTDVLQADKPVLVDYWAEWCGPCKMIAPILDDVAKEYDGRLQVTKMNVDENRDVPGKYGIRGIPTLMLFKGGELAATKVGALSKAQLSAFLDAHL